MPVYKRIDVLQIMRIGVAMAIALAHFFSGMSIERSFSGGFGVAIFFMICGFLLHYTNKGKRLTIKEFFKKKIARLIPLYWVSVLGVFLIAILKPSLLNTTEANFEHLFKSLLFIPYYNKNGVYLPINPVGWTLTIELFVYVVYYLLMQVTDLIVVNKEKLTSQFAMINSLLASIVFGILYILGRACDFGIIKVYCDHYMIFFSVGLIFGIIFKEKFSRKICIENHNYLSVVIGIGLVLIMLLFSLIYKEKSIFSFTIIFLFVAIVILFSKIHFPLWLTFIGDISYSVYITHFFVAKFYTRIAVKNFMDLIIWKQVLHVTIYLILVILVATVSYYIFEKYLFSKITK